MAGPEETEPIRTLSVWAAATSYEVTTRRPKEEVALMYQRLAASLGGELTETRQKYVKATAELAGQEGKITALKHRLQVTKRLQLLAGLMSLVGAVLIGFGVNYLTDDKASPGWAMLGLGSLLQVIALGSNLVDRD